MRKYSFSIVVGGKKITTDDDLFDISDALYEAGCSDAHPAAYNGTLYVNFTRNGENYAKSVSSAISDIESVSGLTCLSVDIGDVVSLSDAAELAGTTKAALSRYSKGSRGAGDFPTPILRVDSSRPLWSWADIAEWLEKNKLIDNELVEQARMTGAINTALSIRNTNSMDTVFQFLYALKSNNNHTIITA
ncbi:DNA-binding protein [Xenorhabdus khoisanae]|uniref:helix-turn-helix transcriptional regulator n=1 Tax=Xenorhabdus TaxID=626 RepID=UPI00235826FD|nr:DNA-binding protein [Xenorhabdus khoisanae]MDC9615377.1 DNA-binding protein [Xenorhabdus khoisanae]